MPCIDFSQAANLEPDCRALNRVGGVKRDNYIGKIDDIASAFFVPGTGLTELTLKEGKKLVRFRGTKDRNNTSNDIARGDGGKSYTHTVNFTAFISDQADLDSIEAVEDQTDLFVIAPHSDGSIRAYGLFDQDGNIGEGLSVTGGPENSGTAKTDASNLILTFTGTMSKRPVYVVLGVDQSDTVAQFEAMTVPVPAEV